MTQNQAGRPAAPVLSRLASARGRSDEGPNVALAQELAGSGDARAIRELVQSLHGPDRALRSDAIKVLYEIGELSPRLIAPYLGDFFGLLRSKESRLVWGGMCAIDTIAAVRPAEVFKGLSQIRTAAHRGSVIARDHAVKAMVKLAKKPEYAPVVIGLLLDELKTSPVNQLPMYAELVASVESGTEANALARVIRARLKSVAQPPKRRRLDRVLRTLQSRSRVPLGGARAGDR